MSSGMNIQEAEKVAEKIHSLIESDFNVQTERAINFWNGNANIYLSGKVTINTKWYPGSNSNIYLMEGAEVTIVPNSEFGQSNVVYTICEGARLKLPDNVEFSNQTVYNAGTIETATFKLSNSTTFASTSDAPQ